MNFYKSITFLLLLLVLTLTSISISYSGSGELNLNRNETDSSENIVYSFFDLRDRESFVQLTNIRDVNIVVHVQIFDVGNNCNENNFFDAYTPNDTHIYNIRDILTNDGNPSGIVLPGDAYGIVAITRTSDEGGDALIGNFRILDNNGYEYRTNSAGDMGSLVNVTPPETVQTFNFNQEGGVILSDVVGLTFIRQGQGSCPDGEQCPQPIDAFISFDVDIYNNNEVPFSCRNIIFACIDQDNPLLPALLEEVGDASVASFEYGINDAIPHSKGSELLCPNNVVGEGIVRITALTVPEDSYFVSIFVGLNNGNGRGSMDMTYVYNQEFGPPMEPPPG